MNKQEAKDKIIKLNKSLTYFNNKMADCKTHLEILQKIIDAPEPKTGRVMSVDDLVEGCEYFVFSLARVDYYTFTPAKRTWAEGFILCGVAFHDKSSCEQYMEQLKFEQSVRVFANE